ncbi:MAG: hypothetical protein MK085_10300 [Phycisphaerales bacterium]|nr:hypothetical protein [Phycisphaerales bacterium]
MKNMKTVFAALGVVIAGAAFAGDAEVIEIPRSGAAVAGPAGTFGTCCSASSYIAGSNSTLDLRGCETMGGYCMNERRSPVVVFDLESIPEDANIESVRLVGSRTTGAGSSDGRLHLLFTSSSSISGQLMALNNSPHETVDIYWAGSGFSHQLDPAFLADPIPHRYLAISMYTYYDSTTYVRNSGGLEPKLRITLAAPPCPADFTGDGVVDSADLGILLAYWGPKPNNGDINGDGVTDAADLGLLLSMWGDC